MYGLLFLLKHAGTAFHNAIVLQHLPNGAEEAPAVKEKAEILDILAVQTGFTGISSSSRPLICAQPVRPGRTPLAPYLSRSAIRSS